LDADSIYAVVHEIGEKKTVRLVYDEKETQSKAQGCVAVTYLDGSIVVYWRILGKMTYPHCGQSIADYVASNCSGPTELQSTTTTAPKKKPSPVVSIPTPSIETRVRLNNDATFYEIFDEKPPQVLAHGWIGITYFKSRGQNEGRWKSQNKNEAASYSCLKASQIVVINPVNAQREYLSEIITKQGGKYYVAVPPDVVLDIIAESYRVTQ